MFYKIAKDRKDLWFHLQKALKKGVKSSNETFPFRQCLMTYLHFLRTFIFFLQHD